MGSFFTLLPFVKGDGQIVDINKNIQVYYQINIHPMKNFEHDDEELMKFSWVSLFSVTATCFYLFGFFMWLLEGDHILLFLKIGSLSMVLASLAFIHKHSSRKNIKKITSEKVSIFNED